MFNIKLSRNIIVYHVISLFVLFGCPPLTMDAVLAIVVDGRRAICQNSS
jgi:hypothetical protein